MLIQKETNMQENNVDHNVLLDAYYNNNLSAAKKRNLIDLLLLAGGGVLGAGIFPKKLPIAHRTTLGLGFIGAPAAVMDNTGAQNNLLKEMGIKKSILKTVPNAFVNWGNNK